MQYVMAYYISNFDLHVCMLAHPFCLIKPHLFTWVASRKIAIMWQWFRNSFAYYDVFRFKYEYYNNGAYVSFQNVSTLESLCVSSVQKEMALNNISIILSYEKYSVRREKRGEGREGVLYMFVRIGKVSIMFCFFFFI